jgi:hypothetical protein
VLWSLTPAAVTRILLSPDARLLAAAVGGAASCVYVFDLSSSSLLASPSLKGCVNRLQWSADGRVLKDDRRRVQRALKLSIFAAQHSPMQRSFVSFFICPRAINVQQHRSISLHLPHVRARITLITGANAHALHAACTPTLESSARMHRLKCFND